MLLLQKGRNVPASRVLAEQGEARGNRPIRAGKAEFTYLGYANYQIIQLAVTVEYYTAQYSIARILF